MIRELHNLQYLARPNRKTKWNSKTQIKIQGRFLLDTVVKIIFIISGSIPG
jgi:hypothetical protein